MGGGGNYVKATDMMFNTITTALSTAKLILKIPVMP